MENTNNIKDYEGYIGKQVKGFKFEGSGDTTKGLSYNPEMDDYVGKVGFIEEYDKLFNSFIVIFPDDFWRYPADLVIKQLEQKEELVEMMEKDKEAGIYDDDSEEDVVNNPSHYQLKSGIQVIDIIEGAGLGFHLANVIKYVLRAGKKDPSKTKQDIDKAIWYLERFKTTF